MLCVADGDTNFRPHNNRTDNLFPVLLYIVPESPGRQRNTHIRCTSAQTGYLRSSPHKDIFRI